MLVGLVCTLGEAQLMPIYHRMRGTSSKGRSRRRGLFGSAGAGTVTGEEGYDRAFGGDQQSSAAEPWDFAYRYEIKYLVEAARIDEIESAFSDLLLPVTCPDGPSGYYNHTIYFDSPAYRVHDDSAQDERVTVMPRIRAYRPTPLAPPRALFLELKRRYDRVIAKRRTPIDPGLAEGLLAGPAAATGAVTSVSSTLAEFQYLVQRFKLSPSAAVLYHRTAFVAPAGHDIRVTFDRLVQYSPTTSLDFQPEAFSFALPPDQVVVEVKFGEDQPIDLLRRLRQLGLRPLGFSKYACALEACGRDEGGSPGD